MSFRSNFFRFSIIPTFVGHESKTLGEKKGDRFDRVFHDWSWRLGELCRRDYSRIILRVAAFTMPLNKYDQFDDSTRSNEININASGYRLRLRLTNCAITDNVKLNN